MIGRVACPWGEAVLALFFIAGLSQAADPEAAAQVGGGLTFAFSFTGDGDDDQVRTVRASESSNGSFLRSASIGDVSLAALGLARTVHSRGEFIEFQRRQECCRNFRELAIRPPQPFITPSSLSLGASNTQHRLADVTPEPDDSIRFRWIVTGTNGGLAPVTNGSPRSNNDLLQQKRADLWVGVVQGSYRFASLDTPVSKRPEIPWAWNIGGDGSDLPRDADIYTPRFGFRFRFQDTSDDDLIALVVGTTTSTDFTTTPDALDTTCGADGQCDGTQDGFFTAIHYRAVGDPELLYSTYLGGSGRDTPNRVAVNLDGLVCVTGQTSSADLVTTANAFDSDCGVGGACENSDAFLMCFDLGLAPDSKALAQRQAGRLVYSTYFGGSGFENSTAIALDLDGQAVIAGTTRSADLDTSEQAAAGVTSGGVDAFVARFNPAANTDDTLAWSTYLGGSGTDVATAAAIDLSGRVWVVGNSHSMDFPVSPNAFDQVCDDGASCGADLLGDGYVTVVSQDGRSFEYSTYLGGSRGDRINDIDIDVFGDAYIVGGTRSPDFPISSDAYDTTCGSDGMCDGGREFSYFGVIESSAVAGPEVGMLHGANFGPFIAPNTWTSVFLREAVEVGTRIWGGPDFVDGTLPTALDGVSVLFNGEPGYVSFISPGQFNVLSRSEDLPALVKVEVTTPAGDLPAIWMRNLDFAPAFFMFDPQGRRYIAAVHLDGTFVGPPGLFGPALTTRPAAPGDTIQVFGTGFGPTAGGVPEGLIIAFDIARDVLANPVTFQVGEQQVSPSFGGLVGAGLYQFNVPIGDLENGDHEIQGTVEGASSVENTFLAVEAP